MKLHLISAAQVANDEFHHGEQLSFDPLDFQDHFGLSAEPAAKQAQAVRREVAKLIRSKGFEVKSWTLTGQLRPYSGWNQPDGRVRSVYYLNVYRNNWAT